MSVPGLLGIQLPPRSKYPVEAVDKPVTAMMPQVPSFTVPPSPLEQQRQVLIDLLANPPKPDEPKKKQKTGWRTKDAVVGGLGLLAAGLMGGETAAASFAQGYAGGKEKVTQDKNAEQEAEDQRTYAQKVQDYNSKLASTKTMLDFMQQDEAKTEAEKRAAQSEHERLRDDFRMLYQSLSPQLGSAKTKPDMLRIAGQLRYLEGELGLPPTAPDEAAIDIAWRQKSGMRRNEIEDNWRQTEDQYLRRYGYVPADAVLGLQKYRAQLIDDLRSYGVEDATLPEVSSETTLAAKEAERKKREFATTLKYKQTALTQRIAESKANRELRKQFLDIASRNSDTSRMNYELRLLDDEAKKINKDVDKQLRDYESDLRKLRGEQKATTDYSKRQTLEAKIQGILADKVYIESQREEEKPNAPATEKPRDPVKMVREQIASFPDKARGNAALRAIDAGADPYMVWKRLNGG